MHRQQTPHMYNLLGTLTRVAVHWGVVLWGQRLVSRQRQLPPSAHGSYTACLYVTSTHVPSSWTKPPGWSPGRSAFISDKQAGGVGHMDRRCVQTLNWRRPGTLPISRCAMVLGFRALLVVPATPLRSIKGGLLYFYAPDNRTLTQITKYNSTKSL